MFIRASSTISFQPTFRNAGFSGILSELNNDSNLLNPDYGGFIPAIERRRMSDVLKMSIACTKDCLEQAHLQQPDAIIVGTSMGCPIHTRTFLDKIYESEGGLISPTSFIQSTHNTIAGQISLLLKNHSYNMTHTQNSLSFEHALIDAMMCLKEGCQHVLVGAADEIEKKLYNLVERLAPQKTRVACGASFFILSGERTSADQVRFVDAKTYGLIKETPHLIRDFLKMNEVDSNSIDQVLYAGYDPEKTNTLHLAFGTDRVKEYHSITGTYLTNSAFAMHIGIDMLDSNSIGIDPNKTKRILICNNLIPENLGLILLEKKPY